MLHDLLKTLRESEQLDVVALAHRLDIKPHLIEGFESQRIEPTKVVLEKYSSYFNIPGNGLIFFHSLNKDNFIERLRFSMAEFIFRNIKRIYEKE